MNKRNGGLPSFSSISITDENINLDNGRKVWIETYGCSASKADGEIISGILKDQGYKISSNEYDADINVIVTCSVKDVTEHKMVHRIRHLSNTNKPLVIGGCLPQADRFFVERLTESASLIGPNSIDKVGEIVNLSLKGQRNTFLDDTNTEKINLPKIRQNPIIGIIEIASGCLSECSFCQTKLAKGMLQSYRIGSILQQLKRDLEEGVKEIWLTSTDNGCYGKDIGSSLPELIDKCSKFDYDYKIRIGMMNPMYIPNMLDDLVDVIVNNDRVYNYLHIPVQSGSPDVLREMKRPNTERIFTDIVQKFRSKSKRFSIATDIIIGYPTETENDFDQTLELLRKTKPDFVNVSKFSSRPGTKARHLKKIPDQILKDRIKRVNVLIKEIFFERNLEWLNTTENALVNEVYSTFCSARNDSYKPIVIKDPSLLNENDILGKRIIVTINGFTKYALRGKLE